MWHREDEEIVAQIRNTIGLNKYPKTILLEDAEGCLSETFDINSKEEEELMKRLDDTGLISVIFNYDIWYNKTTDSYTYQYVHIGI